jgi:hypothetical protein
MQIIVSLLHLAACGASRSGGNIWGRWQAISAALAGSRALKNVLLPFSSSSPIEILHLYMVPPSPLFPFPPSWLCCVRVEWPVELVGWCCGSSIFILSCEAVRICLSTTQLLLLPGSMDAGGLDLGRSACSASTHTRSTSSLSLLFISPSTPRSEIPAGSSPKSLVVFYGLGFSTTLVWFQFELVAVMFCFRFGSSSCDVLDFDFILAPGFRRWWKCPILWWTVNGFRSMMYLSIAQVALFCSHAITYCS